MNENPWIKPIALMRNYFFKNDLEFIFGGFKDLFLDVNSRIVSNKLRTMIRSPRLEHNVQRVLTSNDANHLKHEKRKENLPNRNNNNE